MDRKILIMVCLSSVGYLAGCAQTPDSQGTGQPSTQAPTPTATPSPAAPVPPSAARPAKVIYLGQQMRYLDARTIDSAVLTECQLPQQGAELLEAAARAAGINVLRDDRAVTAGKGRAFQVEIVTVVSAGNPFIGHRKQVTVRGRLLEDGKEIANFQGTRSSMGGAFGGFKGSCSVLGRCLETLAKDMTLWLQGQAMTLNR